MISIVRLHCRTTSIPPVRPLFTSCLSLRRHRTRPLSAMSSSSSPSSLPIKSMQTEAQVAIQAVLRACRITKSVQSTLTVDETVTKPDKSPVTVADLSSQSLISLHLLQHFPTDKIIGEEDTTELRSNDSLRERVVSLVNSGFASTGSDAQLNGSKDAWATDKQWSERQVLEAIDAGSFEGGPNGRAWTIDPIDGTLGFLRKQQYAVCLALLVDGVVELGLLACPNLGVKSVDDEQSKGVLFLARRGEGSWSKPLPTEGSDDKGMGGFEKLSLPPRPDRPENLRFLESVESGHSAHDVQARIGELLGVPKSNEGKNSIRMDSQTKYGALGRGEGGVYLRIPTKYMGGKDYQEKIWDHASGSLLIAESGGICTDMHGRPLDFSKGRTLKANEGIVAAGREMHSKCVEAVKKAVEEAQQGKL